MFLPISDDAPPEPRVPIVTWTMIALNVLVAFNLGFNLDSELAETWGFVPAQPALKTAFSCMFIHAGIGHLLGNMWFLKIFGDNVEARLGHFKFLICYLLSGFGGTLCHYSFFSSSQIPTVGASGAIYGVMGMYLYLFPFNRVRFLYFFVIFIGTTYVSAIWAIGYFFVTELFLGYLSAANNMESGVGHLAHLGGLVAGMFIVFLLVRMGFVEAGSMTFGDWVRGKRRPAPAGGPGLKAVSGQMVDSNISVSGIDQIVYLIHAGRVEDACGIWRREAFQNPMLVLPPREQLELALTLDQTGAKNVAKDAYERLIEHHENKQPYAAEAHLALSGLMLDQAKETADYGSLQDIKQHLLKVLDTHPNPQRKELAASWLAVVESAL